MKDRFDRAAPTLVAEKCREPLGRDDGGELALGEVAPFVAVAEPVADDEIMPSARLERSDQIGADETGAAGDEDHRACLAHEPPRGE